MCRRAFPVREKKRAHCTLAHSIAAVPRFHCRARYGFIQCPAAARGKGNPLKAPLHRVGLLFLCRCSPFR
jgi:hypothetical protein